MTPTHFHKANYAVHRLPNCYLVIAGTKTHRITKHKFGSATFYKTEPSGYLRTLRDSVMYVVTGGQLF